MVQATEEQQKKVRVFARALGRAGYVHAYGHCSLRLDTDHFLVCAAKPMGLIEPGEDGTVVPVTGDLPEGVLGEVRIHQYIYQNRPDVGSVCRTMPPNVMALSALHGIAKPRHGFGTYFSPEVPMWDDPQLIRSAPQAEGVADLIGDGRAVIMRGNGLVTAGESAEQALTWVFYAEDMCRVELEAMKAGSDAPVIPHGECEKRATVKGMIIERMWDYLTHGDPEL